MSQPFRNGSRPETLRVPAAGRRTYASWFGTPEFEPGLGPGHCGASVVTATDAVATEKESQDVESQERT
jgi:hypothetical protein